MSEATELQRAVESLTSAIAELRAELVRKDVYESDQRTWTVKLDALETKVDGIASSTERLEDRRSADRRLVIASFIAPVFLLLLQFYANAQGGG